MIIKKKIWPESFNRILSGDKTFEIRLADWQCKVGDILVLREWDPETKKYTGRLIKKKVTFVYKTKDIKYFSQEDIEKYGLQILAFK
jgi:hypothetical protein